MDLSDEGNDEETEEGRMTVELPPGPVHFVNRHDEQERAFRALEGWRGRARPLILALRGPAGLGKTELAGVLARKQLDRFPDGVLSVDLDDFRVDGAVDPGEVLDRLLRSLGVEPSLIEEQFAARCGQWRNKTFGISLILIVDNVRYASELVPLLPASGDSVVIVASHGPLYDLEAGAAVDLPLPPLEEEAATELLGLIVQDSRLATDPDAVRELVRICDGLPTALHVAGQWVRAHPLRPMSSLIRQLRGDMEEKGIPGVERVWDTVCGELSRSGALLYRLLPHHPGATFTVASATALLGLGEEACQESLEELVQAGLLDLQPASQSGDEALRRMRLPGPLRAHALRQSRRDAGAGEVAAATGRVVRWFARQAQRADRFAAGRRLMVADVYDPVSGAPDAPLPDPAEAESDEGRAERSARASRWLYEERHALFACARLAHARGLDAEVVALSEPVWTFALDHPGQLDVVEVFRLAVDSAVRHGANAAWLVRTRCQLARPLWESGKLDEAGSEMDAAMSALRLLGDSDQDRKLTASAIEFRGMLNGARGEWDTAVSDFARSRDIHRTRDQAGAAYGIMLQTYRMGEARAKLGELEEARHLLEDAHASAREQGRGRMTGRTGFALAGVLRRLGRSPEAKQLYEQYLRGARRRRSSIDQIRAHDELATVTEEEGRAEEAAEHRAAAHAIRQRNGLV
ncbi:tetratricopeptide repeat protein [Streptomyces sp. NPDC048172]|uniref:tetratricopeptide repeat protein n=1 Tax=Streptomyces sp. NPDC048172 TaxID=3365505 RepID=UPI0037179F03